MKSLGAMLVNLGSVDDQPATCPFSTRLRRVSGCTDIAEEA